ncbi:MAG: HAMP domain-containing protein [Anaerolineae bacterium]|nr:HAMP domain-containing protein [Anaerolineae bacterium]MCA9889779.1 HAMP domain-containing protein [Anaerolineae bacterium]MCB9459774.1 HAMP domain-containing protein [Anaerolineaceae bacterium]
MMHLWHSRSLRSKLLILYLGLLLLPIVGVGLYGHVHLSRTLQAEAVKLESQQVLGQAVHIQETLEYGRNDLFYLADLSSLDALADTPIDSTTYEATLQATRSDLLKFASTNLMYRRVIAFDNAGRVIVFVQSDADGVQTWEAIDAVDVPTTVRNIIASPIGSLHMTLSRDNGRHNIVYALRTPDGIVMIEIHGGWLFRHIPPTEERESWALALPSGEIIHYTDDDDDVPLPSYSENLVWQQSSFGSYRNGSDVVFFQHLQLLPDEDSPTLVVFRNVPQALLYADLSTYYQTFSLLAIGAALCVVSIALTVINRFVEPIRQLKDSVDTMRTTNKTPALPTQVPPDEIGDLTMAFYLMALELEDKREAERELVEKLITAQEEERKRIAYDLHDGLLQQLVGARFYLNQCQQTLCPDDGPVKDTFVQGYDVLSEAIVEGRRIIQGLHPTVLDDLGLVEAIAELGQTVAKLGGCSIDLDLEHLDVEPDKVTSVTLYRITQEALNNILKHAKAKHIHISLRNHNGIRLKIEDDGRGFTPDAPPESTGGWGIRTMNERVNLLKGKIDIDSMPGEGTAIRISIPDNQQFHDREAVI